MEEDHHESLHPHHLHVEAAEEEKKEEERGEEGLFCVGGGRGRRKSVCH